MDTALQKETMLYQEWIQKLSREGIPLFIGQMLQHTAQQKPHALCLILDDHTTISYAQAASQASHVSAQLHHAGIKQRDKVMICIENSPLFLTAYYGAMQLGAIVLPVNTFLQLQELLHIIQEAQPDLLILSPQRADELQTACATLPLILTQDQLFASYREGSAGNTTESISKTLDPDEPVVILYTSGTTGFPKGVMLSSRGIIHNIAQTLSRLGTDSCVERILCPLPLFHSFTQNTCVWGAIAVGATLILLRKITRTALLNGAQHRPTIVVGIPGLYALLCRLEQIAFPYVRIFACGGDALSPTLQRYFSLRFGRKLCNGYGLTEAGPVISIEMEDAWIDTHAIGIPLPNIRCKLENQTDSIGTLWVSGPNLMLGYYNAPEATAQVMRNGWLDTGDLAEIDPQGRLIIRGRARDLIISKGMKIYPQEIETALSTHPSVLLVAVIGVTDNQIGQFPVAFVQLMPNARVSSELLRTYCSTHVASYKLPRYIILIDDMPITATGKVDKKKLSFKQQDAPTAD